MLYIDPSTCIECGSCIPMCPVNAIYDEFDLPEDKMHWKLVNEQRSVGLPVIDMEQPPLGTAAARRSELGLN
jgi:ferredoxin